MEAASRANQVDKIKSQMMQVGRMIISDEYNTLMTPGDGHH